MEYVNLSLCTVCWCIVWIQICIWIVWFGFDFETENEMEKNEKDSPRGPYFTRPTHRSFTYLGWLGHRSWPTRMGCPSWTSVESVKLEVVFLLSSCPPAHMSRPLLTCRVLCQLLQPWVCPKLCSIVPPRLPQSRVAWTQLPELYKSVTNVPSKHQPNCCPIVENWSHRRHESPNRDPP